MQQNDKRSGSDQENTKSFWNQKNYRRREVAVSDSQDSSIQWSKRYFLRCLLPRLQGKTVLDLGCGPGVLTPYLAAACENVVGLDFSSNAIATARKRCAHLENVSFISGDVLDFSTDQKFDVITGSMFLHEVMHKSTPEFLDRLDSLMAEDSFLYFHENSYFNVFGRFVRRHLVGKYGIPKHGSENELPFDEPRFALYSEFFRYCERYVEGVELAIKIYEYMIPLKSASISKTAVGVDKILTSIQSRTGWLDNFSYTQTIYASKTVPRSEIFATALSK